MANDLRVCARLAAKNCPQRYLQVGDELVSYVTGIGELRQKFVAAPSV
jgi:2-keto-4-pentenoate hydratase/2-oxohepta-3-ene-1,7-dioic acid hydratase in catechol pathway